MNDQRRVIYEQRSDIMDSDDVTEIVEDMRSDTVNTIVADACPQGSYPEPWDIEGMKTRFAELLNLEVPLDDWLKEATVDIELIEERVGAQTNAMVAEKATGIEPEHWTQIEKSIMIPYLYQHWKDNPATIDALRQVVHLRASERTSATQGKS